MNKELVNVSKYLSFLLRHKPESIGLELDDSGWASIQELIEKTTEYSLTPELLKVVVETNDKQRFVISDDSGLIRANQGHSINVDLGLKTIEPPVFLVHGTADKFLSLIESQGLVKGKRHHVHLTESVAVAKSVGSRYGKPVILKIDAAKMQKEGYEFFKTPNNVWLVDHVPIKYIEI
ncbi:RNA 2'-phosphotransferase [Pseudomonas sp. HK3]